MTPVFIFAEHIRAALKSGKKEIELPQGARISAAAMELINDHKMVIHKTSEQPIPVNIKADKKNESNKIKSEHLHTTEAKSENPSLVETDDELPEEVVEDIVNRVIKRFKQIKGQKPVETESGKKGLIKEEKDVNKNDDLVICRCEEITKEEIRDAIKNGIQTLNGIKRVTRAGMGLCQGQTCQRLVTQILAQELGLKPADIKPTTARGPVRPVHLAVFANS